MPFGPVHSMVASFDSHHLIRLYDVTALPHPLLVIFRRWSLRRPLSNAQRESRDKYKGLQVLLTPSPQFDTNGFSTSRSISCDAQPF